MPKSTPAVYTVIGLVHQTAAAVNLFSNYRKGDLTTQVKPLIFMHFTYVYLVRNKPIQFIFSVRVVSKTN